jgi:hypothetical protein
MVEEKEKRKEEEERAGVEVGVEVGVEGTTEQEDDDNEGSQAKAEIMKILVENFESFVKERESLGKEKALENSKSSVLKSLREYNETRKIERMDKEEEIRDSFISHTLDDNPDTGEPVKCKVGLCPFCYDGTDKKKQFVIIDKNNYFCFLCYRYKATSKFMKYWVKDGLKYMQKLGKYPGEMLPDVIKQLEEDPSSFKEIAKIRAMIYDPDPKIIEIVNDIRYTKTYKSYPKEISDENRLIITLYRILQYSEWKQLSNSNPNASDSELEDEFHAFIKSGKI